MRSLIAISMLYALPFLGSIAQASKISLKKLLRPFRYRDMLRIHF